MATKKQRLSVVNEDGSVSDNGIQEKKSNSLTIKLDHMRTIDALTPKQADFFAAYKKGGYCMALLGSPGVGKCQGEDVEVNLMVPDHIFDKLMTV